MADRGASIRVPHSFVNNGYKGYLKIAVRTPGRPLPDRLADPEDGGFRSDRLIGSRGFGSPAARAFGSAPFFVSPKSTIWAWVALRTGDGVGRRFGISALRPEDRPAHAPGKASPARCGRAASCRRHRGPATRRRSRPCQARSPGCRRRRRSCRQADAEGELARAVVVAAGQHHRIDAPRRSGEITDRPVAGLRPLGEEAPGRARAAGTSWRWRNGGNRRRA